MPDIISKLCAQLFEVAVLFCSNLTGNWHPFLGQVVDLDAALHSEAK